MMEHLSRPTLVLVEGRQWGGITEAVLAGDRLATSWRHDAAEDSHHARCLANIDRAAALFSTGRTAEGLRHLSLARRHAVARHEQDALQDEEIRAAETHLDRARALLRQVSAWIDGLLSGMSTFAGAGRPRRGAA